MNQWLKFRIMLIQEIILCFASKRLFKWELMLSKSSLIKLKLFSKYIIK